MELHHTSPVNKEFDLPTLLDQIVALFSKKGNSASKLYPEFTYNTFTYSITNHHWFAFRFCTIVLQSHSLVSLTVRVAFVWVVVDSISRCVPLIMLMMMLNMVSFFSTQIYHKARQLSCFHCDQTSETSYDPSYLISSYSLCKMRKIEQRVLALHSHIYSDDILHFISF
ncbi:hypothetical protein EGR_06963 [Echinococcus granulosus]|uniref:Uncharacterized protein n=1 Tax=Echinococcus granulosus TaxID=6210 RepID=W6UXE9_ECHGR|nr:hypothetical protein EGR_06963 [Echinococcus granulosus]EUB58219.1 hypothetical protein EGR_06963 [Echinococcus granulosus]